MNAEAPIYESAYMRTLPELWRRLEDEILADWLEEHPGGTRPFGWWEFSAPRLPKSQIPASFRGTRQENRFIDHRRVLRGQGELAWRCYAYAPFYERGIPLLVHTDPADPPIVESEASYLRRHRLLTAAENKKLTRKDFEPIVLQVELDEPLDEVLAMRQRRKRC